MSAAVIYRDPIEQGLTLTEKAVDVHVIDGEELLARWYHSPHEADLLIWFESDGKPSRFQLNSMGQIIDWSPSEGLRSGLIIEIEMRGEIAETIQFDETLNRGTVDVARLVLSNGTEFTKHVREHMLTCLEDIRAGAQSKLQQSRSRFWGRFQRWTTGN